MPTKIGERTASSATRFTATTPHASSKVGSGAVQAANSRFAPGPGAREPRRPLGPAAPTPVAETPEQRVARLRAAHQAAKNANVSLFDSFLARTRPILDSAHRMTVIGLVGLTAFAGLMTAYTAFDMLRYNRNRKLEFQEIQSNMLSTSLTAARLAYMRGEATDEQIALVEEANARPDSFKLPSILSGPLPLPKAEEKETPAPMTENTPATKAEEKKSSLWGFFAGRSKKDDGQSTAEDQRPRSLEEKRALLESVRAALEQERENQKKGGPLDRLGTETENNSLPPKDDPQPKKKGWLW